jgi:hypothetical protein
MASKPMNLLAIVVAVAIAGGCKQEAPQSSGTTATTEGTATGTTGTTGGTGSGSSIPTLVNVSLENVLNDLSVSLQVNRDSIPVTAQVPVDVAAAVCGVSVNALAASLASGNGSCKATTTSPQLVQVVQQQISTGGSVTGGDQTTTVPTVNNMM